MAIKKILLCTDFSENSVPVKRLAIEYAQAFGAGLVIVHVIDTWAGFPMYHEGLPVSTEEIISVLETEVESKLALLAKELSEDLPDVKTRWVVGVPAEQIVSTAREESCELIMMGTHGWSGLRHFFLGSVAERVLRLAECPVLVVRPAEKSVTG